MVHKNSTVKKSASHKTLKKSSSSSSSHSHASHHDASSSGFKMFAHCRPCKCKVTINNCKYITIKGKGSKMRTSIEGVCEKGHKFNRFAKSSDVKSSSKTMKGGALPNVDDMSAVQQRNKKMKIYKVIDDFFIAHPLFDIVNGVYINDEIYKQFKMLLANETRDIFLIDNPGADIAGHLHFDWYQKLVGNANAAELAALPAAAQ